MSKNQIAKANRLLAYHKSKSDAVDNLLEELEQIEEEKLCSDTEFKFVENKAEQRLANIEFSEYTKQLILSQGKIIDVCDKVEEIVMGYWGTEDIYKRLNPLYIKMYDFRRVINELMGDIIFDSLGDAEVGKDGVKEI